ncbi:glycoside hydrolase family 127 protein [candidate division KSB1 bacterium]|nr:glycoside hydrolase family 127 protein [candidate division KSB1 bacterium]
MQFLPIKNLIFITCLAVFLICSINCKNNQESRCRVTPFDLAEVTLLDGPFKHATELNKKSLLNYDPDRLVSKFRSEAGLEPKAEPYHGWEAETIAGHSLGHYLSACALMYQTTHDSCFLKRAQHIVDELEACQQANGNGYLGAIPNGKKILEEQVANGDIRSQGFDLNGIWVPFYSQHKVMAGLRDAYHLCDINKALEIEKKYADWLGHIVENLNDEQIQKMLRCEHGGINEVLVDLYADTKEKKYLDLSRVFHHKAILDSLAARIDILPNKHGNTQIPKLIGLARRYELTGDLNDKKAAEFFWDRVVFHHSYVTGGHGNHEYFGQPDQLRNRLSDATTETCNVYNMLKLSRHLFQWNPRAEIADFYERALFNHILSSQHPKDGRVIYNLSLEMGGLKSYQDPEWFTCCIGTGMENHSKYGRNIFFKNKHELYVSQFIAAAVYWKEKDMTITQKTQFPEEQGTTIDIKSSSPQKFTLYIRYPYWAEQGVEIYINGEKQPIKRKSSGFIALRRVWNPDDEILVKIPFTLRLENMPDDKNRAAILYGPLVMAGNLGPVDDPAANNPDYVPVLITEDRNPALWLSPVDSTVNTFTVSDKVARPKSFTLIPFYTMHDRRYSVYWDIFTEERWNQYQQEYRAELERKKELEEKTVDFFQPGEMQQERDHNFQGERSRVLEFRHKKARVADRSGWFSFELNVKPGSHMALVIHYWGGFTGSKTFDILINGKKIATENISGKKDGQFIDIQYDIEPELIAGKNKLIVRFEPHEGHRAGPFFGARTIKRN